MSFCLELKKFPDKILMTKSEEVIENDLIFLNGIFKNIERILYENNGLGIASNQIGIPKRFFYIPKILSHSLIINPEIIEYSKEKIVSKEGCLSIPGIFLKIQRSKKIKVKFYDLRMDKHEMVLENINSVCFQHEFDHLNGILILNRTSLYNLRRKYSRFYVDHKKFFIKEKRYES